MVHELGCNFIFFVQRVDGPVVLSGCLWQSWEEYIQRPEVIRHREGLLDFIKARWGTGTDWQCVLAQEDEDSFCVSEENGKVTPSFTVIEFEDVRENMVAECKLTFTCQLFNLNFFFFSEAGV